MVGKVDILMGSFSKTFASPGGFVACKDLGLKFAVRSSCGPSTFTNAMTPIEAAVIDAALSIVLWLILATLSSVVGINVLFAVQSGAIQFASLSAERQDVFDYIEMFYNPARKHARNGMLSTIEFEL